MPQFDFDKNYIKNIIFDLDGVLVSSVSVCIKAATKALAEIGISATPETFLPYNGAGEDKFISGPLAENKKEHLAEKALGRLYDLFEQYVYTDLKVFPSAHTVLGELKNQGFHLAIASSSAFEKVRMTLDAAKIPEDIFDVIITGSDVSQRKPSPEIYFAAMDELDADPEECIIVEDALNGIRAAKSADAFCFAVTTSFPKDILEKENPDFIADDIIKLLDIL